ncbi:MAG: ABC transporter ATP-binding protein [Bacteroidota bacterium]
MSNTIEARGLTKDFGDFRAVDNLSFGLEKGEIFGLLGPNGAGKTTTLRMLSGLLTPTAGDAFIMGKNVHKDSRAALNELGFLTGDMDLYRRLRPAEVLTFFGQLYSVEKSTLKKRVDYLIDLFGISEFADRQCEKLSTGQKQKVGIARTLVHDPQVIVLDEPTTGLDIMAAEFILKFMNDAAKKDNKTVLFSTHNLAEVERLCDRVGIISHGKMAYLGDQPGLLAQTGQSHLHDAFFKLVNA